MSGERELDAILNIWHSKSNISFNGIRPQLIKVKPLLQWFLAMTLRKLKVIKGDEISPFVMLLCDNSLKKKF